MCGIIGISKNKSSLHLFQHAIERIKRRGPDNNSVIENDYFIFGHTRLSIRDLDTRSNQPFLYTHGGRKIFITFNGEIYNFDLIKENLKEKGYKFITNSDTEVLCAAYCEFGLNCFDRFVGMWAVAISENSDLILCRDRRGKKPLYYSISEGSVAFSSSLESVGILRNQFNVSAKSIELYFALGFVPSNFSIYEGIFKVEPGQIIHFKNCSDLYFLKEITYSIFKPLKTELNIKKSVFNAIELRLGADVPICTLMSGGVDSTIVASILNTFRPGAEAFFVDFNDKRFSEYKWARYLSKRNNINLNYNLLTNDEITAAFNDYYKVFEEPFADYSGIPSIAVFNIVSKKFKVVLTGDGGDELFFGYPHYVKKFLLFHFFYIFKTLAVIRILPMSFRVFFKGRRENFEANYLKNHGILTPFSESYINVKFNEILFCSKSYLHAIIHYDRKFYNWPEKYLVKIDRSSMFSGVEARSPFMDEELEHATSNKPLFLLFTPYFKKAFLKILYFKKFGLAYFFSKKKGFTPPIKDIRKLNYTIVEFDATLRFIKHSAPSLYDEVKDLNFEQLGYDEILFDRFFFFYEWVKRNRFLKEGN